jgi:hypothetical protein
MYKALRSYKQMNQYVNFLSERGSIAYDDNHQEGEVHRFKSAEKDLGFLKHPNNQLDDMIREEK